jgi:FdhE protein
MPVSMTSPPWIRECQLRWESRITRARILQPNYPAARPILEFYEAILRFQADLACHFDTRVDPDVPFRSQIDLPSVVGAMPSLVSATLNCGPDALKSRAEQLQREGKDRWRKLLDSALHGNDPVQDLTQDFFARVLLQPVAENLQSQQPVVAHYTGNICPICGARPQLSVLRPEGEGASRFLTCSLCFREWSFRRIACPWCGEEDKEKLPTYSAEECNYIKVEACDNCLRYLKAVDLSQNGLAVPLVDETALAALDVWAVDHGYQKIVSNLVGF